MQKRKKITYFIYVNSNLIPYIIQKIVAVASQPILKNLLCFLEKKYTFVASLLTLKLNRYANR